MLTLSIGLTCFTRADRQTAELTEKRARAHTHTHTQMHFGSPASASLSSVSSRDGSDSKTSTCSKSWLAVALHIYLTSLLIGWEDLHTESSLAVEIKLCDIVPDWLNDMWPFIYCRYWLVDLNAFMQDYSLLVNAPFMSLIIVYPNWLK